MDDPELWKEMKANADAFIYAGAPSSSTTSYAFKWAAELEKMGLPGVVLMYDTLLSVAETTRKRQGAEVRYVAIPFPSDTMSPLQESKVIDDILGCLTLPLKSPEQQTGYEFHQFTCEFVEFVAKAFPCRRHHRRSGTIVRRRR